MEIFEWLAGKGLERVIEKKRENELSPIMIDRLVLSNNFEATQWAFELYWKNKDSQEIINIFQKKRKKDIFEWAVERIVERTNKYPGPERTIIKLIFNEFQTVVKGIRKNNEKEVIEKEIEKKESL